MIFVDSRVGSSKKVGRQERLNALLASLRDTGVEAEPTTLEYGDFAFHGRGAGDVSVDVGIELKTMNDLTTSLRTGRLSGHQLTGLRPMYDFAFLIIEGLWRTNSAGQVVTYQGKVRGWVPLHSKMAASEMEKRVLTLELCGGLHVRYTNSRVDTVRFIANLYRWWTDAAMDHHTSHLAVHDAPTLVPISDHRNAFRKWPGIGLKASKAVADHFGNSLRLAAGASLSEWAGIAVVDETTGKSRRLGEKVAERIVRFCEGR